jgi:hypothetical protein
MRQYPRQTIHTDKLPAWAGVQLRPLFVSPSLTGRRCTSQEPMSERDLTRHVCRVLSFVVVRYRSGLLKKIASSEKSLLLYRLVSKKTSYKPVYIGRVCARNWKGSCSCRKIKSGHMVMQRVHDRATKNVPGAIDGARDRCTPSPGICVRAHCRPWRAGHAVNSER